MNIKTLRYRMGIFLEDEQNKSFLTYAGMQTLFWCAMSVGNYLTVFLQEEGFTASSVGIINALNSAITIFATPFWGMISDKIRSVRKVVLIVVCGLMLTMPLIPLSARAGVFGFSLVYISIPLCYVFRNPSYSLIDNWTIRIANEKGLNFGSIRGMGSLGFAIVGFIMGSILPSVGVRNTFFIAPIMLIPFLVICFRIKNDAVKGKSLSLREMNVGRLFKNYHYVAHLLFSVGLNLSLTAAYVFLPYLITSVGAPGSRFGIVTGCRALLEVPMLLFLSQVLRRKFQLHSMIMIAGMLFGLEMLLDSFATGFWQIIMFSTLQGLASGLNLAAAGNYIYRLAPTELKATAQMLNGSLCSVAGIVGNLMGGVVIDALGISTFYRILGFIIFVVTLLYMLSFLFGERVLKIPSPKLDT